MWHSSIPYVTEAIWQSFNDGLLMVEQWPPTDSRVKTNSDVDNFSFIQEAISAIRNARSENKIEPARKVQALVFGEKSELLLSQAALLMGLRTGVESFELGRSAPTEATIKISLGKTEIYLLGAIDPKKEKERLLKEKTNLESLITNLSKRLNNEEFVSKAPKHIVQAETDKLNRYKAELENISATI